LSSVTEGADLELSGRVLPALPEEGPDDLLSRLTDAWLDRQASPHTRKAYERDFREWIGWCHVTQVHPLKARVMDTDKWLAYQRDLGMARRSIARRLSAVTSWYAYLIENTAADPVPLITYNPAVTKARPKVDRDASPTVGLTRHEADRLIRAADADGLRSSAIIRLMLTNATRCDTICTAEIEMLGYDRGHRVITIPVKGGKIKRDPIPPPTARAIDAYLVERGNPEDGPLFATSTGRHLAEPYLFRLVRRLAAKAGIPSAGRLSPHSLRHTAITEALDATHDLRKAQDLAGHADPRTTRLYDLRRGQLDGHAAYVLATRYGAGGQDDALYIGAVFRWLACGWNSVTPGG
jgi:integrase/recombinase XerD